MLTRIMFVVFIVLFQLTPWQTLHARGNELENKTITAIPGIRVGHYTDAENIKGCTVIRFPAEGATAAVDVRGSAPGTRETDLLAPVNLVDKVHAIVLSGGSAYGLDAASGVMSCLEQDKIGFPVGEGIVVPIVPAAVLFDLDIGNPKVRPSAQWGFQACRDAVDAPVAMGNVGAGAGATVGKFLGKKKAMKSGLGSALLEFPEGIMVGAVVAVNALGDVINPETGDILAGVRGEQPGTFHSSVKAVLGQDIGKIFPGSNTTIGLVATNVPLSKVQLKKVAQMAHDGMARAINPAHTMYDGDTIFTVSVPSQPDMKNAASADTVNFVGAAAAEVLAKAIMESVRQAESVPGYPSASDWNK